MIVAQFLDTDWWLQMNKKLNASLHIDSISHNWAELLSCGQNFTGFCTGSTQSTNRLWTIHQQLTRISQGVHHSCAVEFTNTGVTLKESRWAAPRKKQTPSQVIDNEHFCFSCCHCHDGFSCWIEVAADGRKYHGWKAVLRRRPSTPKSPSPRLLWRALGRRIALDFLLNIEHMIQRVQPHLRIRIQEPYLLKSSKLRKPEWPNLKQLEWFSNALWPTMIRSREGEGLSNPDERTATIV